MKKLLKSKICGSVNSARDPRVAENWLKSQTFRLKKKKSEKHKHASRKCVTYPKALILYEEEKENKEDDIEEVYEPNMAEINVRDD